MAESIRDIERHIKSVKSTEHLTNAMKLVSASKFKKAKDTFDRTHTQLGRIMASMDEILVQSEELPEGYECKEGKLLKNPCCILITSTKGLCGNFNGNAIHLIEDSLEKKPYQTPHFFSVGTKGRDFFQKRNCDVIGEWEEGIETATYEDTINICKPCLEGFKSGRFDELVVVYTAFVNSLVLEPRLKILLPVERKQTEDGKNLVNMEFSPDAETVTEYLITKYVEMSVYEAIVESAACEHIARRNAMDTATDNARDMIKKLTLEYNRARQAGITNELIEIVSGAEAQK